MQHVVEWSLAMVHVQVLGFPEDIFEEAALVAESLQDTLSGSACGVTWRLMTM